MKAKHGETNDFIKEFRDFKNNNYKKYFYLIFYPEETDYFFSALNEQKDLYAELIITKEQYLINKK